jgi:hypothetical protein
MQPNFLAICSYFSPLFYNTTYIGFGSAVLLTSHIESAATSLHFQKTLIENYDYDFKEAQADDLSVPSQEEVENFFQSLAHNNISFDKYQIMEALQFFFQALGTADKTIIQIASEAMADNINDPNPIIKESDFMDDGKKSDIYGILKMMRNISYESAKRSANHRYLLKKEQLEALSVQKLESIYTTFKNSENIKDKGDSECVDKFWDFLKSASKSQLKKYGIDSDSHIFHHREEYAYQISDNSFNANNEYVSKFIRFITKTMSDETVVIEDKKCNLDYYIIEVVKNSKESIWKFLNENRINYAEIKKILIEIDDHLMSASKLAVRVNNFIYGSELAPYPKFLAREIIVKNDYVYLERLSIEHPHGIKGVYAKDQEEIFITAYKKDKTERNNWKWIKLLSRTGFEFSDDQKKALLRDIIGSNDSSLLHVMVENRKLNLFEYQKDRGITFYHSLLIDGSDELLEYVHSNYIIEEPLLKVKFIPNYQLNDQGTYVCPYWSPHENNFKLELKNFDLPGMKIRKNWDFLMIAAAAGRVKIARALMDRSIDTSGYERIKDHLKDQSVIASIVRRK